MKLLPLLFALLLAACGGGGDDDDFEQAGAAPRAAMAAPAIVVRMHGDSTQHGLATDGVNSATVAQSILTGLGRNIQVIGQGIGSTRTEQRLNGGITGRHGQTSVSPWPDVLAAEPADIVTFRYGINDAKYYSERVFRRHVERLIELSEAAGMSVILETPSPTDFRDPVIQAGVERNVAMLKKIARQRPSVTLCNHWDYGLKYGYENSDGIHPTVHSYEKWNGPKAAVCIRYAVRKRAG